MKRKHFRNEKDLTSEENIARVRKILEADIEAFKKRVELAKTHLPPGGENGVLCGPISRKRK